MIDQYCSSRRTVSNLKHTSEKPFPSNVCDNSTERSKSVRKLCQRVLHRVASFNEIFVARHVTQNRLLGRVRRCLIYSHFFRWPTTCRTPTHRWTNGRRIAYLPLIFIHLMWISIYVLMYNVPLTVVIDGLMMAYSSRETFKVGTEWSLYWIVGVFIIINWFRRLVI